MLLYCPLGNTRTNTQQESGRTGTIICVCSLTLYRFKRCQATLDSQLFEATYAPVCSSAVIKDAGSLYEAIIQ